MPTTPEMKQTWSNECGTRMTVSKRDEIVKEQQLEEWSRGSLNYKTGNDADGLETIRGVGVESGVRVWGDSGLQTTNCTALPRSGMVVKRQVIIVRETTNKNLEWNCKKATAWRVIGGKGQLQKERWMGWKRFGGVRVRRGFQSGEGLVPEMTEFIPQKSMAAPRSDRWGSARRAAPVRSRGQPSTAPNPTNQRSTGGWTPPWACCFGEKNIHHLDVWFGCPVPTSSFGPSAFRRNETELKSG